MTAFTAAFPLLYHVTRTSSLAGIRRDGLLPASVFLNHPDTPDKTTPNRDVWTEAPGPDGRAVWLRWQNLRDEPLRKRLPDGITPAEWRRFINGMVFLFTTAAQAQALRAYAKDQAFPQAIIGFRTTELLAAGCDIRVCRWNNGYLDRSRPPRLRTFADYRPAGEWRRGDSVKEVVVVGGIPAQVPFETMPS